MQYFSFYEFLSRVRLLMDQELEYCLNPFHVCVLKMSSKYEKNHEKFRFSDLDENFTRKVFWCEKFKNEVSLAKFWPPGGHFGGQRSILGCFWGQKGQKSRFSDFHENFTWKAFWCGKFNGGKICWKFWPPGGHFGGQRSILGCFWGQKRSKI